MRKFFDSRWCLPLLVAFGFAVRLPGCFWGVDFFHGGPFIFNSADEQTAAFAIARFVNQGIFAARLDYFYGLGGEMIPPIFLLRCLMGELTRPQVVIAMRVVNVFFACGTIVVTYKMARAFFEDTRIAFFSALFLALFPLYVIHSHRATPAIGMVFWTYLSLFASYLFQTKKYDRYWYTACAAAGAAIAVKYGFITLIPIFYLAWTTPSMRHRRLIGLCVVVVSFEIMNCFMPVWKQVAAMTADFIPDNFAARSHAYWFNPIAYLIALAPGLGIYGLLMSLVGWVALKRKEFSSRFIYLEIPLIVQAILVLSMSATFPRHLILFFPYLALLAGIGLVRLEKAGRAFPVLVVAILAYQTTTVAWIEYQHVRTRAAEIRQWLYENIRDEETVDFGLSYLEIDRNPFSLPEPFLAASADDARFLLFGEGFAYFPFFRSILNPLQRTVEPAYRYGWQYLSNPRLVQAVLYGDPRYERVAAFPAIEIIPEFIVYKRWFGSYNDLEGDWSAFKKRTS